MLRVLRSRLPNLGEVISVYAVIVFILFGWATLSFFWKFPAWLFYLNLGEVAVQYLYTAFNEFLESLIYLVILLVLCAALPVRLLRDRFPVHGTISAIALVGFILLTDYFIAIRGLAPALSLLFAFIVCGGLALAWMWLSAKYAFFEQAARFLVERVPVFLYIYVPVVILSIAILLIRNVG